MRKTRIKTISAVNKLSFDKFHCCKASCIIAHLFVELALPCSCCKREDGVIVIQGKAYDGSSARVTIKGEEVRYYGKQRTLAAIRAGQCRPPALRP